MPTASAPARTIQSVYRVLLVEDNPGDAAITMERLEESTERQFVVVHVTNMAAARTTLSAGSLDAVILDLNLPDSQGPDTLTGIKAVAGGIPVIVVSQMVHEELRHMVLALGADDMFTKSDAAGRPFSRSIQHVIERNRARSQHLQYEGLLEGLPDAVLVVARVSGLVRYVNRAALELFGVEFADILGERLGFSVNDEEPTEIRIFRRGELRECEMRIVPFDWQGEAAYLASIHDFTDIKVSRREAEARATTLRRLMGEISALASRIGIPDVGRALDLALTSRPEALTGEVLGETLAPFEAAFTGYIEANGQLRSQNRELADVKAAVEATNRELEAFSYSVAHDLRAPLRSVAGFGQALVEDCGEQLGELGLQHLWRIRDAAERMNRIIDALLKLSRITRSAVRRVTVDLSSLASGIVARLQQGSPGRSVTFTIAEGLIAEVDRTLIESALENLLANAFKFTARRTIGSVEFGARVEGSETVYFVRDDGVGFDPGQQQRLFGVFQRLHGAEDFEGTGIGLSIVRRIVERHGGRVWAEGERGRGATFYFTLGTS